ncbi:NUDIX domain-containing protein [Accumulibacter sp.]|uniref:NUDIX domain-containing protein n=1 Tax=Accumulibacter sp. TaxID=2053492 RepID=UPI0038FC152D
MSPGEQRWRHGRGKLCRSRHTPATPVTAQRRTLPSGRISPNESLVQAAGREPGEETGLTAAAPGSPMPRRCWRGQEA